MRIDKALENIIELREILLWALFVLHLVRRAEQLGILCEIDGRYEPLVMLAVRRIGGGQRGAHHRAAMERALERNDSRTPLRAALQRLQHEEILTQNGKNMVVAEVTEREVRDICTVRMQLEPLAVHLLAQNGGLTEKQLDHLYLCGEKQLNALHAGDNETFLDQDALFHVSLAQLTGNSFLADLVRKSNETIRRFHTLSGSLAYHAEDAVHEHTAVLDRIRSGHYEEAEQALRYHLEQVQRRMFSK